MILGLDTSGARTLVVVADHDGHPVHAATGTRPRAHAEEIGPLVAAAPTGAVTHVAVGRGPGSFTGLRVGLAFGQVWGWSRGVPVTGVGALDVVACQFALTDGWAVLDARRAEVFAGRYRGGAATGEPVALARAEAAERIGDEPVVGDVALLTATDRRAAGDTLLDPAAFARVAATVVRTDPGAGIQPQYLRRPDITWSAAHGRPA